jgi:hypothetical protein
MAFQGPSSLRSLSDDAGPSGVRDELGTQEKTDDMVLIRAHSPFRILD